MCVCVCVCILCIYYVCNVFLLIGFIGKLLKYITPLTVVPTMCLIGLTVVKQGVLLMSGNWIAAIMYKLLLFKYFNTMLF